MNVTTEQLDAVSDYLYSINNKLSTANNHTSSLISNVSTILNSVKNSAGTAIQALQSISSSDGILSQRLGQVRDGLTSSGILAQRLSTIMSSLSSDGIIAQRLLLLFNQLSGDGVIAQRLQYTNPSTGLVTPAGYSLYQILSSVSPLSGLLSSDGILAQRLLTIMDRLSSDGIVAQRLLSIFNQLTSDGLISQRLSGVIDGLDSSASRIIDALGNVSITFPDSITATLSGDATISAETDVAGEAAQTASLYDSLVGEVDADGLRLQLDGLVGVLRTSFPFGCIFILIDACDALSAAPVAPVFSADLPAVVGTYHAEIDLSFFDSVATLWRGGVVVIYVAGLYSATKQWVFNGGGESA